MRDNMSVVPDYLQFTVGNPVIPEQKRGILADRLYLRIKYGEAKVQGVDKENKTIELPQDQQPYFIPFQEDFVVGFVQDMGHSYEFVNNNMREEFGKTDEELLQLGEANILNDIKGNIQMAGDPQKGVVMITCGGNHESALIYFDGFWQQIEESFKSDICMILPVRDILMVANFYNAEAMEGLRNNVRKFYYDKDQRGVLSNKIYLRKDNSWKEIETVEN